jgi:hypothetical protein
VPNRRIADVRNQLRAVDLLEDVEVEQGAPSSGALHVDGNVVRQAVGFAGPRANADPLNEVV